ncbi:MAG: acetyl-CoA carboxylase biotin carboxyl carrier protein subunit [Chloroflexota bacterium]|nr:acetyl-CoA carboxylase biotin carboxyl carrier protein subunit [Chloroflexota bacterium]MDE2959139.1 acetyl-CoA carboxylase biotin carboxyl carrier protein subunit [Chloroflexota bacterium]
MTTSQGQMREAYPILGEAYRYRSDEQDGGFVFSLEGDDPVVLDATITLTIEARQAGEGLCGTESGRSLPFAWAWVGAELHLWLDGALFVFQRVETRRRGGSATTEAPGDILAPMPGAVLEVLVGEGDRVERNQTVVLMESMKMELVITAPRAGVVRRVSVEPGQQVDRGMRLLELGPEGGTGDSG